MSKSDRAATKINERVWVEKVDHSTDPPTPVERVSIQNGVITGREAPERDGTYASDKTSTQEATGAAGQAGDVQGQDGDERLAARLKLIAALGRTDPFRIIGAVARSAEQTGIDLEQALRFMSALAIELAPRQKVTH